MEVHTLCSNLKSTVSTHSNMFYICNCDILFSFVSDECIVFESVRYPGLHAGILENGNAKKPSDTGTGKHAQFLPKVIHEVLENYTHIITIDSQLPVIVM